MELYGCEVDASTCRQRNLGMENNAIKDDQIHSPSSNNLAKYARLNLDLRSPIVKSCWTTSDPSPWLQVDLKSSYYITAVLTQGCGFDYTREWVKKYKISYGNYPSEMVDYKVNGTVK
ncbi:EGF-like repeat and discoidin I-like domain-containing protein 3, partial [Exaiptasia diaphana]|uniref:F5/8 type C domain-containing protein n=1 Tax=Exaiptasia diaphana TaxID=2652724 RepID=A0A913X5H8_EXADI